MKLLILLVSLFLVVSLPAQALNIGTLSYDPPFEMAADQQGHFFGFEVAIVTEICKRMQVQCQFQAYPFNELLPAVLEDKVDLAIAAITISAERANSFLFSLPYLKSYGQVMTNADSTIQTLIDLENKKVGVLKNSIYANFVKEQYNVTLVEYADLSDIIQALASNDVDAIITDVDVIRYWITNNDSFKLVGDKIPLGMGYGMIANKSETILINNINQALLSMETDGTYLKIYTRYFGQFAQ